MSSVFIRLVVSFTFLVPVQVPPPTEEEPLDEPVRLELPLATKVSAELRAATTIVPVGSPVDVEFVIRNRTNEPVTLAVPGALQATTPPEDGFGLPIEHVFSGINYRALEISAETDPQMGHRVTRKPRYPVAPITLAPFASVGLRFDVARFYPGLHQPGVYQLSWRPYAAALDSAPLTIKVVSYRQAVIETDQGAMTMRFLYDKAPRHVDAFLELADQRFYNNSWFHTLYPNQFIVGGCPIGDGSGKRPDGVTLDPEFNDVPFDVGTVGMALLEGDPKSASCQFFICLSRQAGWDGKYTALGRIEGPESLATLAKIGQLPVDENHQPTTPLKIKSITIVEAPYFSRRAE